MYQFGVRQVWKILWSALTHKMFCQALNEELEVITARNLLVGFAAVFVGV